MASVALRTDLVLAAVESARVSRRDLADALHELDRELSEGELGAAIRRRTTTVIGALYTVELGDAARIDRGLVEARQKLGALLSDLQHTGEGPQEIVPVIARALARLHPTSRAIARALGRSPDEPGRESSSDESAPIPLARRRQSSRPAEERRSSDRVSLEADIGLATDTNFYTGLSGDLSEGGMFVSTTDLLPLDTEVVLSFMLPDGFRLTVQSRVAWVHAGIDGSGPKLSGIGLAFVSLTEGDRAVIERFMAQRAPLRVK